MVLKISRSLDKKHQRVLTALSAALSSAPDYITRLKSRDVIANIRTVVNSTIIVIANYFLDAIITGNVTHIFYGRSTMEVEQMSELSDTINCGDYVYVN